MDQLNTARDAENTVEPEPDRPTYDELLGLCGAMLRDWVRLNEFYNQTAMSAGWCPSYEDRQNKYNEKLEVMHLEPRSSALIQEWEQRRGRQFEAVYKDHYLDHLSEKMWANAEHATKVRSTYEAVRLIHDLSMKKELAPQLAAMQKPKPAPEPPAVEFVPAEEFVPLTLQGIPVSTLTVVNGTGHGGGSIFSTTLQDGSVVTQQLDGYVTVTPPVPAEPEVIPLRLVHD